MRTRMVAAVMACALTLCGAGAGSLAQTNPDWNVVTVDGGTIDLAYLALAYDPADGRPSIAYQDRTNNRLKFAHFNGTSWDIAIVASGGNMPSLAYAAPGVPAISYMGGGNKPYLRYSRRGPNGWPATPDTIGLAYRESSSLTFGADGTAFIAQPITAQGKNPSKIVVWRKPPNSASWLSDPPVVTGPCMAVSLATDPLDGKPSLAYVMPSASNCDRLYLTHRVGDGSWATPQLIDGAIGGLSTYDRYLAFEPLTGHAETCTRGAQFAGPRFERWSGTQWTPEIVDPGHQYISSTRLAFDSAGVPYIGYVENYDNVRVAHWDGVIGQWVVEEIERVAPAGSGEVVDYTSMGVSPLGRPGLAYWRSYNRGFTDEIRFAEKIAP